jgi:hypothetical protein
MEGVVGVKEVGPFVGVATAALCHADPGSRTSWTFPILGLPESCTTFHLSLRTQRHNSLKSGISKRGVYGGYQPYVSTVECNAVKEGRRTNSSRSNVLNLVVILLLNFVLYLWRGRHGNITFYDVPTVSVGDQLDLIHDVRIPFGARSPKATHGLKSAMRGLGFDPGARQGPL